MRIIFRDKKLKKLCNDSKTAVRQLGPQCAEVLRRRLDDLDAADTLNEFRCLPGDCHEYKHGSSLLTLDLHGGKRIIFRPDYEPIPTLADGISLDWCKVTAVEIIAIEDPHGKRRK